MGPDQTAPLGEVWLKLLAFATAIKFIWWHKSPRRLVILNMICILPLELLSLLKRTINLSVVLYLTNLVTELDIETSIPDP